MSETGIRKRQVIRHTYRRPECRFDMLNAEVVDFLSVSRYF